MATAIEYGLITALVSVAAVAAMTAVGTGLVDTTSPEQLERQQKARELSERQARESRKLVAQAYKKASGDDEYFDRKEQREFVRSLGHKGIITEGNDFVNLRGLNDRLFVYSVGDKNFSVPREVFEAYLAK